MSISIFAIFLLDLVLGSVFKLNYNFKLIWWLDFVAALSMLPVEKFGLSVNYLEALKVTRATRLLKLVRVSLVLSLQPTPLYSNIMFRTHCLQLRAVRLAKIVRLLRLINLSKKKVNKTTFRIGDEEETNIGDQLNADHLREQLTTVTTVKVGEFASRHIYSCLVVLCSCQVELGCIFGIFISQEARGVCIEKNRKKCTLAGACDDVAVAVWAAHHRHAYWRCVLQSGEGEHAGDPRYGATAHYVQQHPFLRQQHALRVGLVLQGRR